MSCAIIRITAQGRRAFPISAEDADKLVADGEARKVQRGLYESVVARTYTTKVLVPEDPRGHEQLAVAPREAKRKGKA
jgi:hypothetical protein